MQRVQLSPHFLHTFPASAGTNLIYIKLKLLPEHTLPQWGSSKYHSLTAAAAAALITININAHNINRDKA